MALFEFTPKEVNLDTHYAAPKCDVYKRVVVHFANAKDMHDFSEKIGMTITTKDKFIYYDKNKKRKTKLISTKLSEEEYIGDISQHWEYWWGMPEYLSYDNQGYHFIEVRIKDEESCKEFIRIADQKITEYTKYIWYPKKDKRSRLAYTWVISDENIST